MMSRRALGLWLLATAAVLPGAPAHAGPPDDAVPDDPGDEASEQVPDAPSRPVVTLSDDSVAPGDTIIVTFDGFGSHIVVVVVCGNEGRRGSQDCNMRGAKARETVDEAATQTRFVVPTPPMPCPCIVRVSDSGQSELAVAEIELSGHPVAAPVDPAEAGPLVDVTISAAPAEAGALARLRTALAGSTDYDVTVTVRNRVTTPIPNLFASASVGRGDDDDLALIPELELPARLEPGETWQEKVTVELPTPVYGTANWRVSVGGAGAPVEAETSTRNVPTALVILVVILVLDILVILGRSFWRRRRWRPGRRGPRADVDVIEEPIDVDVVEEPDRHRARELERTG